MLSRGTFLVSLLVAMTAMAGAAAPEFDVGTPGPGSLQGFDPDAPDALPEVRRILGTLDAERLGPLPVVPPPPTADLHEALRLILERHDLTGDDALAGLERLDDLGTDTRTALAELLASYVVLHDATTDAFDASHPPHLASVAAAQHQVLDKVAALRDAVAAEGPVTTTAAAPIVIGPMAIDITGTSDTYDDHFAVIIDLGGDDTYLNNAGGNGFSVADCGSDENPIPRRPSAALLVDIAGNDQYRSLGDCGVNGGGAYGSGMLVDLAGNDLYEAGGKGTNGGAFAYGLGLLVDMAGDDDYVATGGGANGGGYAGGMGRLIETRGRDEYTATSGGTNGGARGGYHCVNMCQQVVYASGILLDLGGRDIYTDLDGGRNHDTTELRKEGMGMQLDFAFING